MLRTYINAFKERELHQSPYTYYAQIRLTARDCQSSIGTCMSNEGALKDVIIGRVTTTVKAKDNPTTTGGFLASAEV